MSHGRFRHLTHPHRWFRRAQTVPALASSAGGETGTEIGIGTGTGTGTGTGSGYLTDRFHGAAPAATVGSKWRRIHASPITALVGVVPALAAGLLFSFGFHSARWEPGQWVNVVVFVVAYVVAWLLTRRYSVLTGSSTLALSSIAVVGAAVLLGFAITRSYYSLWFLFVAFAVAAAWLVGVGARARQVAIPTLAVIPGGHVDILEGLPGVRLILLRRPPTRRLPVDGIVVDRHVPHDAEWHRFVIDRGVEGIPVHHCADVYERFAQKVSIVHLRENDLDQPLPPPYATMKRVVDLVGATVGLVGASPILLVAAVLIRREDGGPILFTQERVGARGEVFRMHKLRSMRPDAEADGPRMAVEDDARTTRIGAHLRRWRIDELPQLWNVLRGEMSIVGPRPEQVAFVRRFEEELPFYAARHAAKPGITGWAQVRAGYASDLPETQQKLVHDLYYVRNMSVAFDAYIVMKTVWIVVSGFGAR